MPKPNPRQWDSLPDVLTIRDAAVILHMCETSVRQACVSGKLPAVKICGERFWRISKNNLRAMLEGGENKDANKNNNRTAPAAD